MDIAGVSAPCVLCTRQVPNDEDNMDSLSQTKLPCARAPCQVFRIPRHIAGPQKQVRFKKHLVSKPRISPEPVYQHIKSKEPFKYSGLTKMSDEIQKAMAKGCSICNKEYHSAILSRHLEKSIYPIWNLLEGFSRVNLYPKIGHWMMRPSLRLAKAEFEYTKAQAQRKLLNNSYSRTFEEFLGGCGQLPITGAEKELHPCGKIGQGCAQAGQFSLHCLDYGVNESIGEELLRFLVPTPDIYLKLCHYAQVRRARLNRRVTESDFEARRKGTDETTANTGVDKRPACSLSLKKDVSDWEHSWRNHNQRLCGPGTIPVMTAKSNGRRHLLV